MATIKERLAALNKATGGKVDTEDKAAVARAKPMNDRLATLGVAPSAVAVKSGGATAPAEVKGKPSFACWVKKQGAGIMAATFMSRWCEVYSEPPLLRFYTDAMATQFKGDFRWAPTSLPPCSQRLL